MVRIHEEVSMQDGHIYATFSCLLQNTMVQIGTHSSIGRSFIVCIAPYRIFSDENLSDLCASINENVSPVTEIWSCQPDWYAPVSYRREMGNDVNNIVLLLEQSIAISDLPLIKYITMQLEDGSRSGGRRCLNLNPGIALPDGVLVASHKPKRNIRQRLSNDVWGQWVLDRQDGAIIPSPNTFGEYCNKERLIKFQLVCGMGDRTVLKQSGCF